MFRKMSIHIVLILLSLWSYNGLSVTGAYGINIDGEGSERDWINYLDSLHPIYRAMFTDPSKIGEIVKEKSIDLNSLTTPRVNTIENPPPRMSTLEFAIQRGEYIGSMYFISNPSGTVFGGKKANSPLVRQNELVIEELLKAGADIHQQKALRIAISAKDAKNVKLFLEMGAVIGPTDLHQVVSYGSKDNVEIVELLLSYGADPTLRDQRNRTPYMIALESYFKKPAQHQHLLSIIKLLEKRAKPSISDLREVISTIDKNIEERIKQNIEDHKKYGSRISNLLLKIGFSPGLLRKIGVRIDSLYFFPMHVSNDIERVVNIIGFYREFEQIKSTKVSKCHRAFR